MAQKTTVIRKTQREVALQKTHKTHAGWGVVEPHKKLKAFEDSV